MNLFFTCERFFFLFKQLFSTKRVFVPSHLFLDFVFILFPTSSWGRSQHSLVWTPTSSHQCLLKAQIEQPAAPAGIYLGKEVLMQPLRPHTAGTSRRPASTALGLTGEDFLPKTPWSYLNGFDLPTEHAFHLLWELLHQLQAVHLFDLQSWLHIFVLLPKGKQKILLSRRLIRRGANLLLLAGYCLWWRKMCWKNWSDLPPSPIFAFRCFSPRNLGVCRSLAITQSILT